MIKKIQPKDIYKQALAFEKCAKILHDHYDFWDNSTKIVEFMNESLSVELYLKAILLFEKKKLKELIILMNFLNCYLKNLKMK